MTQAGQPPARWHWVYGATVFRLDHRGQTAGGRPVISQRGYVMTRGGVDTLRTLLWAEAQRRGLAQAATVLVVADGAVWIWNLVADRFGAAHQLLDYYHASQHLWAVAAARHGVGRSAAGRWNRVVGNINVGSSAPDNSGVKRATKPCWCGKSTGATAGGRNYFRTWVASIPRATDRRSCQTPPSTLAVHPAPLTKGEAAAYPEIAVSGGVVAGKEKPPFVGGTVIPPTTVEIITPATIQNQKER